MKNYRYLLWVVIGICIGFTMRSSVSFGKGGGSAKGCVDANRDVHFHVKRSCVDQYGRNPTAAIHGLDVTRVLDKGKLVGYRVSGVASNPFARSLGLKNGDVVTRINGRKLDGLTSALRAYAALSKRDTHTVVVKRNGKTRVLSYWIYR